MGDIRFVPMGPGRYRKIPRKKKVMPRRTPVGPPLRFQVAQKPDFRALASGAGVEERMDALSDMIDGVLKKNGG